MSLLSLPRFFAVNSAGVPYPNAKLYTYSGGTLTQLSTYTDDTFSVPLSNPVVADANGLFPAIFFNPASAITMRFILKTSADVQIWDVDGIRSSQTSFGGISSTGTISGVTGLFSSSVNTPILIAQGTAPYIEVFENDGAADAKQIRLYHEAGFIGLATYTDLGFAGKDILKVTCGSGTAITAVALGNATDNPSFTLNGTAILTTSSFTGSLTNMTGSTTGTVKYRIVLGQVTMWIDSSITGTSNSNSMTMNGLPAAITPTGTRNLFCSVTDSGNAQLGCVVITSGGTVTFSLGSSMSSTSFTGSGTKGLPAGWAVSYSL